MAINPEVKASGSRQRLLVVALAGVLVAVLALLVLRPLLAGTQEVAVAPAVTTASTAVAATTTTLGSGPSTTLVPSARPLGSTKDPFRPLVAAAPSAAATDGSTAATTPPADGSGGATGTTLPLTASTVPGSDGGTATAPGGGSTAERKVVLLDVLSRKGTRYARVSVDGSASTVKEGQSFAGDYRAVDIGTACATFESGTTPFTLCEGEAVLK
jgi:hypothetical protein